ncbi:GNAT family N-acetyltransferase [Pseudomonas sp.]|uniref:GNAT family N-acetyltransferase n=1 Tax=Pseudomonas sp. TaxID=306 RepID=UPI000E91940E|nr:N-acetyltransferase [Pseudomonas sp.]HBP49391.1 GNAT family N-acetyltransferase [Pseudomonas sp.]
MHMTISKERPQDIEAISRLTEAAFRNEEYSSHTEHFIVNALRRTGQLSISLVAAEHDEILGHVAISPVSISSGVTGWYGLGPISVRPDRQGKGIGSALMKAALQQLRQQGAAGCVVLGDPAYYGRFGFKAHPGLELPDVPPEYFQALSFTGELPVGVVKYAAAFDARK